MRGELGTLLRQSWVAMGDRTSIIDGREIWSGRQLLARAEMIGRSLRSESLGADEPVAVYVSNAAEDFAAFLAVWSAGGVVVPIHRGAPQGASAPLLAAAGVRFLVDGRDSEATVAGMTAPPPDPALADGAVVIFTSGSTGEPKGVCLSHKALAEKLRNNQSLFRLDEHDRTLLILQITFSFGLWVSLLTLIRQAVLVVKPRFILADILETFVSEAITRSAMVPSMLRVLAAEAGRPEIAAALGAVNRGRRLAQIFTGGEVYGAALASAMRDILPNTQVTNIFGLSETCTSDFVLSPADAKLRPGSIGRAAPGVRYRLVDKDLRPVPPGEIGELQITTTTIMSGYLGQPALTEKSFADGYFCTGDLARQWPEGIIEVVGRAKEVIIRGANKIYPQEIEQIFEAHPQVERALATGVPDALLGERIHIAVVPAPGTDVDTAVLRAWAAEKLDRFKLPDAVHVLEELPVGRTGKADRSALRRKIAAG